MPKKLGNTTYYDPSEVAVIIYKDYQTALRRIKEGDIDAVKVNRGYLVSHKSLVKYLEEINLPESIIDLRLGKTTPGKKKVATANA